MNSTRTRPASRRAPHDPKDLLPTHSGAMNSSNGSTSKSGSILGSGAVIALAVVAITVIVGFALSSHGTGLIDKITGKIGTSQAGGTTGGTGGTGTPSPDPSTLTVAQKGSMSGYSRAKFGAAWTDKADVEGGGNGCGTRDDILRRDLTGVKISGKCTVESGTLSDPYTGRVISFVRGKETSSAVQIDHLVALGNAWVSGASQWDIKQATRIANDPLNLLAADGPANMGKGDKDAGDWLPANPVFQCSYTKYQVMVKNKYRLTVTAAEKAVMMRFAGKC